MQVDLPFYESSEDAMRAAVQSLGGTKRVGALLWPDLSPDNAGRRLSDTLNPHRSERLTLSQVMRVLQMAKAAGHHGPMSWIASEIGYAVQPVTAAEEVDRLACVVEESTRTLAAALATVAKLMTNPSKPRPATAAAMTETAVCSPSVSGRGPSRPSCRTSTASSGCSPTACWTATWWRAPPAGAPRRAA